MKAYKFFRGLLKASALTTVMFIMQACYGSPNMPPEIPDEEVPTEATDTVVSTNLESTEAEFQGMSSETTDEVEANPQVQCGQISDLNDPKTARSTF